MKKLISNKEFQEKLNIDTMKMLEGYYKKTNDFLCTEDIEIEDETLSELFPAYSTNWENNVEVWIKRPTYKLVVINAEAKDIDEIKELIGEKLEVSDISLDLYYLVIDNIRYKQRKYLPQIICMDGNGLEANEELKNYILYKLTNKYKIDIYPTYLLCKCNRKFIIKKNENNKDVIKSI